MVMDLFEAIYSRRSIRKFLSTPVEFDKIVEVIKAGSHAPSAGDLQNWKFIVVTNSDVIKSMYSYTMEQDAFLTATAAIIVSAEMKVAEEYYGLRGSKLYSVQSCAAAMQNMLLAAHSIGLGAVWIGAFDEDKVASVFGITPQYRAQGILLLGYADETPRKKVVKDIWWQTYFMKFGNKFSHPHRVTRDLSIEWEQQLNGAKRTVKGLREEYEVDDKIKGLKDKAKTRVQEIISPSKPDLKKPKKSFFASLKKTNKKKPKIVNKSKKLNK